MTALAAVLVAGGLFSGCTGQEGGPDAASEESEPENVAPPSPVSQTATLDGRSVHYVDAGTGPTAVVLVHGWASDHSVWRQQLNSLDDHARLLLVDLPGHGLSEPPAREYSMDLFADAIAAVLDDAGVERAVVVGHSNGTPAALRFLRRYPDRTVALVAVDGALEQMFPDEMVEGMTASLSSEDYLDTVGGFVDGMPGDGLSDELRREIRQMAVSVPQEAILGGFLAGTEASIWDDEPITVPLQLILARQPAWTDDYEARIRERAPQVDYRVIEGVSHFLMMERPQQFDRLLLEFLSDNDLV